MKTRDEIERAMRAFENLADHMEAIHGEHSEQAMDAQECADVLAWVLCQERPGIQQLINQYVPAEAAHA